MNSNLRALLLFFMLSPLTVLASGDYVLTALLIDFVLFLVIGIAIIRTQVTSTGKLILFASYLVAMYLLFYVIDQVNYLSNLTAINLGSAFFPPTVVYLVYLPIKKKFKK